MKNYMIVTISLVVLMFLFCSNKSENKKSAIQASYSAASDHGPMITFIELGSVNCIPCKMMQPIMASIEKKYGAQIKIIFYDVWKDDQKQYAGQYGIRLIPTQIFLDRDNKEIMRHEGFFPEQEIDQFLQSQGLTPHSE